VTVALVVLVDDEAVHGTVQVWPDPEMSKEVEAVGLSPGLVAVRVYSSPTWSIDRSENEAMPPLALTVKVPDNDPAPGFDPMATVTAAGELAGSVQDLDLDRATNSRCDHRVDSGVGRLAVAGERQRA